MYFAEKVISETVVVEQPIWKFGNDIYFTRTLLMFVWVQNVKHQSVQVIMFAKKVTYKKKLYYKKESPNGNINKNYSVTQYTY